MNRRSIKTLALFVSFSLMTLGAMAQPSKTSKSCYDKAKTQSDLNECGGVDAAAADRELNRVYQRILKKYADQPVFIQSLREAQRIWLKYRDAQIKMKYTAAKDENESAIYGSVYPMCHASYKAELTARRSKELRQWLTGIKEGDVCAGSVKTLENLK